MSTYSAISKRHDALAWSAVLCLGTVGSLIGCSRSTFPVVMRKAPPQDDMVYVPAGQFAMGSRQDGTEESVELGGFHIDRYETTNEQYKAFVDATGYPPPKPVTAGHDAGPWFTSEIAKHPVVNVSYDDAMSYAKWTGKRLATEQEWERAARGLDHRPYPWGFEFDRTKCNVAGNGTAPVGSFPQDLSPVGCYDMAANVAEWTSSWYDTDIPTVDGVAAAPKPRYRVVRGGAWNYRVASTKVHSRRRAQADVRSEFVGFRCARSD